MTQNVLPESWGSSDLGKVCELYQPKTLSTKEISNGGKYLVYGANGVIGTHSKYNHEHSELLITCRGATCGNVHISKPFSWINGNAMVVRPFDAQIVLREYLYYYFSVRGTTQSAISGSAQPQITRTSLSPITVAIPPLAEQHRIVAKIEELFSELDKGVETLKSAQAQLQVYRQAVLKYAFEGKLTNPDLKDGELPEGWVVEVSSKINDIRDGTHDTPKYVNSNGVPLITSKNLKTGKIDFTNVSYISKRDHDEIAKRSGVEAGDILFAMIGTIGNPVVISTGLPFSIKNVGLFRKNPLKINSNFLCYFLGSKLFEQQLVNRGLLKGTTQKFIPLGHLRNIEVPLPPLNEQEFIVQEIESRLSVCNKIEENIDLGLQQAEALRQSILKKAFEGKLVPQDPNDEPASVLLERIQAERAGAGPVKKTRTKKTKA